VVVLPPGAGKTVVGLVAMSLVGQSTLILTTNRTSVHQWRRELLKKTDVQEHQIAEYTGEHKGIAPVTLATYQMLTHRTEKNGDFPHLRLFAEREWGLIVYDEVHLLPAPVFRATAEIQAKRRLGLTATLVREDGRETDVFSLIGPKKYDVPWRDLEQRGWIAEAACTEVRVSLPEVGRMAYATAEPREMYRIAAENSRKLPLVRAIMEQHDGAQTLVIGQYLAQLQYIADNLAAPLITGKTPQRERERLFDAFRLGEESLLVLSKVGNFALDLPDAELLIQVSGTFGSRQEEAQRLGRILRPKADGRTAHFYTIVTRDTQELDFAHNRQLFLAEQGYSYRILDADEVLDK
jgi:DNA excision repair protein ERCC-3